MFHVKHYFYLKTHLKKGQTPKSQSKKTPFKYDKSVTVHPFRFSVTKCREMMPSASPRTHCLGFSVTFAEPHSQKIPYARIRGNCYTNLI